MAKRLSLKAGLPFSILIVILATFSVATIFIIQSSQSVISYAKFSRLEEIAAVVGDGVSVQLQRAGKDMVLTAGVPGVPEGLNPVSGEGFSVARATLSEVINRIKLTCGYYESSYLANEEGAALTGPFVHDPSVRAGRIQATVVSRNYGKNTFVAAPPYISPVSGDMLLPVALKLVYDGVAGALAGTLQLTKVTHAALKESTYPGLTVFVATSEGKSLLRWTSDLSARRCMEISLGLRVCGSACRAVWIFSTTAK